MHDEFIQLFKRTFIKEQRHAFARRELSGLVLALAPFRAPSRFRIGFPAAQLRDRIA
jgi:hypothetical protein